MRTKSAILGGNIKSAKYDVTFYKIHSGQVQLLKSILHSGGKIKSFEED